MPFEDYAIIECEQSTEKEHWKLYRLWWGSKNNSGQKEQNEWTFELSKFKTKQDWSLYCSSEVTLIHENLWSIK